jgi:hypothetical protein
MIEAWDNLKTEHKYVIVAICVTLIIVLIVIVYMNSLGSDYLYGMWVADSDFCDESDLTGFMIMMGPAQGWWGVRTMYVLMFNDEGTLCNRTVDVQLGSSYFPGKYQNRSLTILDEDFKIMPLEMTLSTSIMDGHMVLYGRGEDSDTIYASMYKDHDSTHKAKALED